jgi:hypothetical protein
MMPNILRGTLKRFKPFAKVTFRLLPSNGLEEFTQQRTAKSLHELKELIPTMVQEFGEEMVSKYLNYTTFPDFAALKVVFYEDEKVRKIIPISLISLKAKIGGVSTSIFKKLPNYLKGKHDALEGAEEALGCASIKAQLSAIKEETLNMLGLLSDSHASTAQGFQQEKPYYDKIDYALVDKKGSHNSLLFPITSMPPCPPPRSPHENVGTALEGENPDGYMCMTRR